MNRTQSNGFFMAMRSPDALELIAMNPHAFNLLYIIAYRAQRTDGFNRHNLAPGQALVGDYEKYGMTEQNYRTAKQVLEKHGFATFKPTGKGSIATLTDTRVFDINIERANGQNDTLPTSGQRTANDYQECKNAKNAKKFVSVVARTTAPLSDFDSQKSLAKASATATDSESQKLKPTDDFYKPTPDEVREYAMIEGLNPDAVEKFLEARLKDNWNIQKRDGRVERVRNWRAFLKKGFCKKCEKDRKKPDPEFAANPEFAALLREHLEKLKREH